MVTPKRPPGLGPGGGTGADDRPGAAIVR